MIESEEEMFEHPDALKLNLISQFYSNSSKYDFLRIKRLLLAMEYDLEVEQTDSIDQIKPITPNKKLVVVIIGDQTRLGSKILQHQAVEEVKTSCPFVIYEQGPPLKPTSLVNYQTFISTNGDKLEACIKIVECPKDTTTAIARDSSIQKETIDYLSSADIVLVSVADDDRVDFQNTRLFNILKQQKPSKIHYLDWQGPEPSSQQIGTDDLNHFLSTEIDKSIKLGHELICKVCQVVNEQISRLKQANTDRLEYNSRNQNNLKFISVCMYQILLMFVILLFRELIQYYQVSWEPPFDKSSIIMVSWQYQVDLYHIVDKLILSCEETIGISSMYLTLIMGLISIIFWFARRQHGISLRVLSNKQLNQLTDFKNYLTRELELNLAD